jgi:hypothetical protein
MRIRSSCVLALSMLLCSPALAKEDATLVESVKTGCQKEIVSYCPSITPGEARVLSCLYSHGDKLSPRCEYALYDAAAQLERVVAALSYVSSECDGDMEAHCASIKPGEGRIMGCLKKKDQELSERCRVALQDVDGR